MNRVIRLKAECLGKAILVTAESLDDGLHILVCGGTRSHCGSVTMAEADGTMSTMQRPSHKDAAVSELFAADLSKRFARPVCCVCGIHYDDITPDGIAAVLDVCKQLSAELAAHLTAALHS